MFGAKIPALLAIACGALLVVSGCGQLRVHGGDSGGEGGSGGLVPFTVDTYPALVSTTTVTLTGTKTTGHGVLANGNVITAPNDSTTWAGDVSLNSGDHLYSFSLQAESEEGAPSDPILVTIALDSTQPTIISRSPVRSGIGISLNAQVEIAFDEAIACTGVDGSSLTVRPNSGGADLAGTVSCDGDARVIELVPAANLASDTRYDVTTHAGVADLLGNATSFDDVWSFTTGTTTDTTPPAPPVVAPAPSPVTGRSTVLVTGTKEAGTSVMTGTSDDPAALVTVVPKVDSDTWQHVFDLALDDNTFYLRSEDPSGNVSTTSSSFSIHRDPGESVAPGILTRTPTTGATGVAVDTTVVVTFSETIDCPTVTSDTFILSGVSGSILCVDDTATLTPDSPLAEGIPYSVTVSSAVSDLSGNRLAMSETWVFTVGDFTDPGPPTFTAPGSPTTDAAVLVGGGRDAGVSVEFRWSVNSVQEQDWTEIVGRVGGTTWMYAFDMLLGDNLFELRSVDFGNNTSTVDSFLVNREPVVVLPPTVDPAVTPTSVGNQVITGTKPAGASVLNNAVEIVPADNETTWSALVNLTPGTNGFLVTASDTVTISVPAPAFDIVYTSNGVATAGQVQIDLKLADLSPIIAMEMNLGDPNHYSVEIWVEGPLTFTGTGPYTYETCYYSDALYERRHTRYVKGIVRGGDNTCISMQPGESCWWWAEPDFFNPNYLAALTESGIWAGAGNPLPPSEPTYTRRQPDGTTWGWNTPPQDAGGCNLYFYYHSSWCRHRFTQGPNTDGITEGSRRDEAVSYTWDLEDHTGAGVELGPYLIQAVITVDRDPTTAGMTDVETCWDRPGHDTIGSHRAEGIIMIDGVTPANLSWSEKGYIDVPSSTPVEYLVGPVNVRYCPTGAVTGACP